MYAVSVTVIAAYWTKNSWAIGADSGAYDVDSDLLQRSTLSKVWSYNDVMFGAAGTQKAINVGYQLSLTDPFAVANAMVDAGIQGEWDMLMVRRDGVWEINSDGSVFHFSEPYSAIGAGQAIALGALAMYHDMTTNQSVTAESARAAVTYSLSAASKHTASCVPPHKVISHFL